MRTTLLALLALALTVPAALAHDSAARDGLRRHHDGAYANPAHVTPPPGHWHGHGHGHGDPYGRERSALRLGVGAGIGIGDVELGVGVGARIGVSRRHRYRHHEGGDASAYRRGHRAYRAHDGHRRARARHVGRTRFCRIEKRGHGYRAHKVRRCVLVRNDLLRGGHYGEGWHRY